MRNLFRGIIASFAKDFKDTFNRADSASLGTPWQEYRNTFGISTNKASASSSDYSIATVDTASEDVTIDLTNISQGAGASLWVTDAGNWWAVGIFRQPEDCNCTEYYNSYTYTYTYTYTYSYSYTYSYEYISGYNPSNCASWSTGECCSGYFVCNANNNSNCCGYTCYGYNTSNCCGYSCYGYNAKGNCKGYYCSCYNGSNCQGNYCSCYNAVNCASGSYICTSYAGCNNCISYNPSNPNYAIGYANANANANANTNANAIGYNGPYYNCGTCYPQYIRIVQSVANTISTLTTHLLGSSEAKSLKVITSGNQITAKAYSDENLVSQIGNDLVYTATGAVLEKRFGLTIMPSAYSQGTTVDEIFIKND